MRIEKTNYSFFYACAGSTFFTGFSPFMPGTASSLFIILLYHWISVMSLPVYGIILLMLLVFSFLSYPYFEKTFGNDPGCFTLDETVATYILIFFIYRFHLNIYVMFFLWRLLDITKPLLIKRVEKLKGIAGVMLDDILAITYTIIIFLIINLL